MALNNRPPDGHGSGHQPYNQGNLSNYHNNSSNNIMGMGMGTPEFGPDSSHDFQDNPNPQRTVFDQAAFEIRQNWQPPKRTLKIDTRCVNCRRIGHRLKHCRKCDISGFMRGCPKCDTLDHEFEECRDTHHTDEKHFLLDKRINLPPWAFSRDIRKIRGFNPARHTVWTPAFSVGRLSSGEWQEHEHLRVEQDEEQTIDPAWHNFQSIPADVWVCPNPIKHAKPRPHDPPAQARPILKAQAPAFQPCEIQPLPVFIPQPVVSVQPAPHKPQANPPAQQTGFVERMMKELMDFSSRQIQHAHDNSLKHAKFPTSRNKQNPPPPVPVSLKEAGTDSAAAPDTQDPSRDNGSRGGRGGHRGRGRRGGWGGDDMTIAQLRQRRAYTRELERKRQKIKNWDPEMFGEHFVERVPEEFADNDDIEIFKSHVPPKKQKTENTIIEDDDEPMFEETPQDSIYDESEEPAFPDNDDEMFYPSTKSKSSQKPAPIPLSLGAGVEKTLQASKRSS